MAKPEGTSLLETPTYYVVVVLLAIVVFSSVFDKLLHHLRRYLRRHGKQGLLASLDAMSTEIMLLGAISLLLLIFEDHITTLCFNRDLDQSWTMLYRVRGCPCCLQRTARVTQCFLLERKCGPLACNCENSNATCMDDYIPGKAPMCLAGQDMKNDQCGGRPGYRPVITKQALHQIHMMVFICALTHIFLSCMVLLLSDLRVREWRRWRQLEDEHISQVSQLLDEKEHICRIRQGRAYMSDKTGQDIEIDPAIGVQIAAAVVFDNEDAESGPYQRKLSPILSGRSSGFPIDSSPGSPQTVLSRRMSREGSFRLGRLRSGSTEGSVRLGRVLSTPHALRSPSFRAPMKQRSPAVELLHSFLRQFTISVVSFEEFAIMRASFVLTHQLDSQFDFVSYVLDRMQDNFAEVVGLGIGSWIQTCIFFLLAGTVGWPALWYSLAMLALLMLLNTKLISIVRRVTQDGTVRHLQPNYFWFKRPWLLLSLIKLLLFLASLNVGTMIFFVIDYGPSSCFFTSDLLAGIIGGHWWEPVLASVVVLLGLGLETLPLYSMAVQMGQKFKDHKDVEDIVAHFRSLPRPDISEIITPSFTHSSMQKVKQALNRTSASWQDFTRSQRGAAPQDAPRGKGSFAGSSSDSDPALALSRSFTRTWRIPAHRKPGGPDHARGPQGLHPVESAPNLSAASFEPRARRQHKFNKAVSEPVPDLQGARSALEATRHVEFYDARVRQSGDGEAGDGGPGSEAAEEVLRRSPSLRSAVARVAVGRAVPERDGGGNASDSGSSVMHAHSSSVGADSWSSSLSSASPLSDQERLARQFHDSDQRSTPGACHADSLTPCAPAPSPAVPENVSSTQPSDDGLYGGNRVPSSDQGELAQGLDGTRLSRSKRRREAAARGPEEPSAHTSTHARLARRPSAVEMCQVVASGAADLPSVVASQSHSLTPEDPGNESGVSPGRPL